jgi:hypothetical protein
MAALTWLDVRRALRRRCDGLSACQRAGVAVKRIIERFAQKGWRYLSDDIFLAQTILLAAIQTNVLYVFRRFLSKESLWMERDLCPCVMDTARMTPGGQFAGRHMRFATKDSHSQHQGDTRAGANWRKALFDTFYQHDAAAGDGRA